LRTPLWASLCNRWLVPVLRHLRLTTIQVARPVSIGNRHSAIGNDYTCSVVVPARNEAGKIEELVSRVPDLGLGTEIVFIEGGSTDDTWEEIQRVARDNPHRDIKILKQTGEGKGQAMRQGLAAASGELLFILDADLSVAPGELARFYEVTRTGTGDGPLQHGGEQVL
jgi:cellulose synthase/poly-beta-1,6-N-acetylglucosamine synthase-like glycosyltransferase